MTPRQSLLGAAATVGLALTAPAAPADAVTTFHYVGQNLTGNTPALGTKILADVTLNNTLAPNFTGSIVGSDINTFTIKSLGGPSITGTGSSAFFAGFDLNDGNVISWNLAATSSDLGGILLGTRLNPLATDTVQAFGNDGTLPDGAQQYTFTPGAWSVQSTGTVPEPASWALMGIGFALVGAAARRNLRASSVTVNAPSLI